MTRLPKPKLLRMHHHDHLQHSFRVDFLTILLSIFLLLDHVESFAFVPPSSSHPITTTTKIKTTSPTIRIEESPIPTTFSNDDNKAEAECISIYAILSQHEFFESDANLVVPVLHQLMKRHLLGERNSNQDDSSVTPAVPPNPLVLSTNLQKDGSPLKTLLERCGFQSISDEEDQLWEWSADDIAVRHLSEFALTHRGLEEGCVALEVLALLSRRRIPYVFPPNVDVDAIHVPQVFFSHGLQT